MGCSFCRSMWRVVIDTPIRCAGLELISRRRAVIWFWMPIGWLVDVGNTAVGADTSACAFAGSNAATLELWHHRLGCSRQQISLMHKESSVLGLGVSGSTKAACKGGCKCSVCQLSRACKRSPAKMRVFEQECTRPFGVVFTDIKGLLMESHGGLRYSIVFIDQVTRSACTYYMRSRMRLTT